MPTRRELLQGLGAHGVAHAGPILGGQPEPITLFLCGDVMTGRGIDQVLPHPSDPRLYEGYMKTALGYVQLAESASGPIPRPAGFAYIWGDAIGEFERVRPDPRIVNLETSITTSDQPAPKGIHYRMRPANAPCLTAAKIDCCVLANNHVLDWGERGLVETLETLHAAKVKTAGAGRTLAEAVQPATLAVQGNSRVLVFAAGTPSSGIPHTWAAAAGKPGVALLADLSGQTATSLAARMRRARRPGDTVVLSLHWGANWGYGIPPEHRAFAHRLIDEAAVDVIHGHSSHHPLGIEVYRNRLILYGCGDFLNDYEGIGGHEEFRSQLVLMYFPTVDPCTQELFRLDMTVLEIRRFRLRRASRQSVQWLRDTLSRESRELGTRFEQQADNTLALRWR